MNGRYALAQTPLERLAIAVVKANEVWRTRHPDHFRDGLLPSQGFYQEQLLSYLEREKQEVQLECIHTLMETMSRQEGMTLFKRNEARRRAEQEMSEH